MTRTFYRIHTEYRPNLEALVALFYPCFAIVRGRGCWQNIAEDSACIEIIAYGSDKPAVLTLARTIKLENAQEAVYVTATPVELVVV